jgi:hypothetical protein
MTNDELRLVAELAEGWLKDLPTADMQTDDGLRVRVGLTGSGEITPAAWDESADVVLWLRHDEDDTWKVVAATVQDHYDTDRLAEVLVSAARLGFIEGTAPKSSSYTAGLRELADWLDAHPEWTPLSGEYLYSWQHNADLSTMARAARDMGTAEKEINENTGTFKLVKRFGPHAFTILADRAAVCERVVVGTHVETKLERVPVGEVVYEEREVEHLVEDVRWICPPSLLAGTD